MSQSSQGQGASSNSSSSQHKKEHRKPSGHHRKLSVQQTEIIINVYDLLPPSKFSTLLWTLGASLLHSGVVIADREYAYGGHSHRDHTGSGLTGVYWTKPRSEPPGSTFKCAIYHGFTTLPQSEIDEVIREAAEEFKGTGYNLLSRNCNHFTSFLVERLTGRAAPGWLNRAANIGVTLPCVVPREWVTPPEADEGELVGGDEAGSDEDSTESSRMLRAQQSARHSYDEGRKREERRGQRRQGQAQRVADGMDGSEDVTEATKKKKGGRVTDTEGRRLPLAERAPVPDQ